MLTVEQILGHDDGGFADVNASSEATGVSLLHLVSKCMHIHLTFYFIEVIVFPVYICIYVYMYVYMYICMYICIYRYICICIYYIQIYIYIIESL